MPVDGRHPHSIVVCSLEPWGQVRRRIQLLVGILVEDDPDLRVLYVEPPVDVPHALRHRRFSDLRPVGPSGTAQVHVLRPRKWLPRLLGSWADRSLMGQVLGAARRLELEDCFLWVNDAHYAGLLERTRWPSIYDITDDWLHSSLTRRARARLVADEAILLSGAGAVVVCSPDLAKTRGATRPVDIIPNGVDVERFRTLRPRPDDLPPSPVALYVGTLHEDRLDLDLCAELATTLPQVQFVLLGPNCLSPGATQKLASLANIHLPGSRPYDQIPAYMQHADVIVIPHKITPFTESLDPIKAYECLAAGRPTVATAVAGFRHLGAPIIVASPGAFAAEVKRALETTSDEPAAPAVVPTWRLRAAALGAVMSRVLAESDGGS